MGHNILQSRTVGTRLSLSVLATERLHWLPWIPCCRGWYVLDIQVSTSSKTCLICSTFMNGAAVSAGELYTLRTLTCTPHSLSRGYLSGRNFVSLENTNVRATHRMVSLVIRAPVPVRGWLFDACILAKIKFWTHKSPLDGASDSSTSYDPSLPALSTNHT